MAHLVLKNIKKAFGKIEVIHDVSMDIKDGEFVALVGPSGCGKSTLLRMIAGLEDPTSGEILIGGEVVNDRLPKDRDIAMVFQSYALYPHMTVRQNICFSLELEKRPKAEIDAAVEEVSEILGLNDYLDRRPKALSGGQRQRVAMGRAIVRNPKVFLFDEPLSNLDAKLRTVMRKEVKLLHQRLKTTSVYVTHDQTEAMTMADTIVVLHAGKIEQMGSPLTLYNHPENLFVAGFIGAPQMNFLTGKVEENAGGKTVRVGDASFQMANNLACQAGQAVVLGIRPEHLQTTRDSRFTATVKVVEPMGNETHLTCIYQGAELQVIEGAESTAKAGDAVGLVFDPAKSHLFAATTGLRIPAV